MILIGENHAALNHAATFYLQSLVVLDSGSEPPDIPHPPADWQSPTLKQADTGFALPDFDAETLIVRAGFSTVPTVWDLELMQEYEELGEALREMVELEDGDEWKVNGDVYRAACRVASGLKATSFPAPRIFNHGPSSVVFNWSESTDNLYLTVTSDRISALVSSRERIKARVELSADELMNPPTIIAAVRASYPRIPIKQLVTGTVPDPPEVEIV